MRLRPAVAADQELIARAWRRIALQTASMFAAALLLLDLLAVGLVLQTGHSDARRQVAQAVADQDALTKPPRGIWIYQRTSGGLRSSPGAPATPIDAVALDSVFSGGRTRTSTIHRSGREYEVQTQRVGPAAVQAVLDVSDAERERHRLYWGLAAAGTAGLILAALVGAVIARRAIVPLGQAFDRQQRFVADASHELRTPLTQLHTRAQLLQRELRRGGDSARIEEDVRLLIGGTRHLGDVVEDLLLAAQLRAEPATFGPVDLAELAAEAVAAEQTRCAQLGVELRVAAPSDRTYVVRGAATALRRVFTSLIDNALGHSSSGGYVTIRLGHEPTAGVVTCVVQDDGTGFDPADRHRMFERFARGGHGDRRRFGLGLALVREAVQAHGGTVVAAGAPGAGATFTVTLPAWGTATTDGAAGRRRRHPTSGQDRAHGELPATRGAADS
ncbi:HAMP domain-containing sensor histidine kinase [Rugosimonospora acidiphila]|uniref:Sensor-like histidine kinase SenX3 n=1 Tax=Rugosimonospora acidiphila TaxID=556531 RepID=A0ABP9RU00_9ACTN